MMDIKSAFSNLKERYVRFTEKQGFAIIAVVCVAVITATAVWTDRRDTAYVAPTPPVLDNVSAAQLLQQSLRDAATATPAPTEMPSLWQQPLDQINVLRAYNGERMVQSGVTGVWAFHDSVDLQASLGDKVYAIADGVVLSTGEDQLMGAWLLIDHGSNTEALYAGLAMTGAYIAGDKVRSSDTIGYAGKGLLEETDLGPHLHLRVVQNGHAIDPVTMWELAE